MPQRCVALGGLKAFTLNRVEVEHLGALQILDALEGAHEFHHVVPVFGTKVSDVQSLEHISLVREQRLDGVVETQDAPLAVVIQDVPSVQDLGSLVSQTIVERACVKFVQVLPHAAYAAVDAHVVVIQDDEHIVRGRRHIVESLEGQAARHAAVADDCHHVAAIALLARGHRHAQSYRNGVGCVTTGAGIIFALLGRGEWLQAAQLAVGVEPRTSSRQYLVAIGLVAHIPHDTVVGGIKYIM